MPNIIRVTKYRKLSWTGHVWKKEGALFQMIQYGIQKGKKPLKQLQLRWENQIIKNAEIVKLNIDWHIMAMDRRKWQEL